MSKTSINVLVVGGTSKVAILLREHIKSVTGLNLFFQSRHYNDLCDIHWDPLNLNSNITFRGGESIKFDVLLNLAGPTHKSDVHLNSEIAFNCCKLADRLKISKVLLASSSAVYGNHKQNFQEADDCHPKNAYGAAKLKMEMDCLSAPFHTNVLCLRMGNFLGADSLSVNILNQAPIFLDVGHTYLSALRSYLAPLSFLRIIRSLAQDTGLQNCSINIANPNPFRMQKLLDELKIPYELRLNASGLFDHELDLQLISSIHDFRGPEYSYVNMINQVKWLKHE